MFRKREDVIKRYSFFLNELYQEQLQFQAVTKVSKTIKKYGISSSLLTYLIRERILIPIQKAIYTIDVKNPFTEEDVKRILNGLNAWKYKKKMQTPERISHEESS